MRKKAAVVVLGCKVNQSEAEGFKELLRQDGYRLVEANEKADLYLVHTCTVTHLSARKCRQIIRRIIRNNPQALVVVSGCYSQVASKEVASITGVDLVWGSGDKAGMIKAIKEAHKRKNCLIKVQEPGLLSQFEDLPAARQERVRAFVKIQDGCSSDCSYCIVPQARGPARSRPLPSVVNEVQQLVREGYREIVLTGVHLGAYGFDLREGSSLAVLLEHLSMVEGSWRLRLSSIEPHDLTRELINAITDYYFICPHYHIPLQSGDDTILRKMNRRYTAGEYYRLIQKIKEQRPGASFTTDVIVGFPGESEHHFQNTFSLVEQVGFSRLHIFKYSPRPGTRAQHYPDQVPPAVKEERRCRLSRLEKKLFTSFASRFVGKNVKVLIEKKRGDSSWEGYSPEYFRVVIPGENRDLLGNIVGVTLTGVAQDYLEGRFFKDN